MSAKNPPQANNKVHLSARKINTAANLRMILPGPARRSSICRFAYLDAIKQVTWRTNRIHCSYVEFDLVALKEPSLLPPPATASAPAELGNIRALDSLNVRPPLVVGFSRGLSPHGLQSKADSMGRSHSLLLARNLEQDYTRMGFTVANLKKALQVNSHCFARFPNGLQCGLYSGRPKVPKYVSDFGQSRRAPRIDIEWQLPGPLGSQPAVLEPIAGLLGQLEKPVCTKLLYEDNAKRVAKHWLQVKGVSLHRIRIEWWV